MNKIDKTAEEANAGVINNFAQSLVDPYNTLIWSHH